MADKGDTLYISADGQVITWLPPRGGSLSGPDGQPGTCTRGGGHVFVVEGAPWGALVGIVGEGKPFVSGSHASVAAQKAGELRLAVNDYVGYWFGNSGGFTVGVQPSS
jgi:hypothetical protein